MKETSHAADYDNWLKADLWTIERAILLLINAETLPSLNYYSSGRCNTLNEQAIYDDFMKIWPIAESTLKTGLLKKTDKSYPSLRSNVLPSDFIHWAESKGYQIPAELHALATRQHDFSLQNQVVVSNHAGTKPKVLSKLKRQQAAILKVIKAKEFKPMAIPDNEKGTIKLICESDEPELFEAETAFNRAWKAGIGTLWRMENHNSFAHRGIN
jgi:hypothetical protein